MNNFFSFFIVVLLCMAGTANPKLRPSTTCQVPTADLLYNKQFTLKVNLNTFSYVQATDTSKSLWWFMPVVSTGVGIANRVEIGAGFAGGAYLQIKGLLINENQFAYAPAVAMGVRDVMASSEAYFFGYQQKDTLPLLTNSVFIALSKTLEPLNSRLHVGMMTNFSLESERITPFAALEIYLGNSAYLTYEGFQRFKSFHQLFSLNIKFGTSFVAGLGLSELSSLFSQNGKAGFYVKGQGNTSGYGAPGYNVTLAYLNAFSGGSEEGFKGLEDDIKEIKRTMTDLKTKDKELSIKLETTDKHISDLDDDLTLFTSRATSKAKQDFKVIIDENLNAILDLLDSKYTSDPEILADHMRKIVEYKDLALPKLTDVIRDPKADPKFVALAIQMIGQIGDKRSKQILVRILDNKEPSLKIEAIIALGKIHDRTVISDIQRTLTDTDETVVLTAQEVLKTLDPTLKFTVPEKKIPEEKPVTIDKKPVINSQESKTVTPADTTRKAAPKPALPIGSKSH